VFVVGFERSLGMARREKVMVFVLDKAVVLKEKTLRPAKSGR
jgi:hypothetical protein